MSDPQQQQPQQDQTFTTILTVLSAALLAAFAFAQIRLLTKFASLIASYGVGDLLLLQMRRASSDTVGGLRQAVPPLVSQIVDAAAKAGADAGGPGEPVDQSFGVAGDRYEDHASRSARAIRDDLLGKLNGLNYRITRFADDTYQAVVADAAIQNVLGATSAVAQGDAYRKLTRRGIDGFVDSRGRKWELSAYVEMAVRTAAQRAFNVSHLDRMRSLGVTYFTVTDDGHPCPLCAPWEGAVLAATITDDVASTTVSDATAAGLFHPNCRHTLVAFFPGVTEIPAAHEWSADDQRLYDESQRQRALERDLRASKREVAGSFTPEMKAAANRRLRQSQANMRSFIEQTGRVRNSRREQLNLGSK